MTIPLSGEGRSSEIPPLSPEVGQKSAAEDRVIRTQEVVSEALGEAYEVPESVDFSASRLNPDQIKAALTLRHIAEEGRIGENWKEVMGHVHEDKKSEVLTVLQNVNSYVTKARRLGDTTELTVEHGDVKFRVIYEKGAGSTATLIFGDRIAKQIKAGQFKKVSRGYEVSQNKLELFFHTKEKIGTEEAILHATLEDEPNPEQRDLLASLKNTRREQDTLTWCRDNNIPGTPETRLVKFYAGKGEAIKQRVMAKFYPGGDLASAIRSGTLSPEQKNSIASGLCETLSKFHAAGRSHNDFRPENVVLNSENRPVVIDFGGATSSSNPTFATGSAKYFPPEMFEDPNSRDLMNEVMQLETKSLALSEKEQSLLDQLETVENPSDEFDALNQELQTVYDEMDSLEENINNLYAQITPTINPGGWVTGKNDCYALGMTLEQMYGESPSHSAQDIINGLKNPDPIERLSTAEAFTRFRELS